MRQQVRNNNREHVKRLFDEFPGMKVIVFDGCCVPGWLIMDWPKYATLVIASDESARWGFALPAKGQFFGPHGPEDEVPADSNSVIKMPESVKPWFKQYYSVRHVTQFGPEMSYMPLGLREEFADAPAVPKPVAERKYVYSFMGAPTDMSRKRVRDVMMNDTEIPKERAFLYMAEHWDANPESGRNTYIKPAEYRAIMLDSIFTLCPKGHSIEQFRFYEAIESGSIPVIAVDGMCTGDPCPNYARERLPPAYFESPIVVVNTWDEVVPALLALLADPAALQGRQARMATWYNMFMHRKITEVEDSILARLPR